MIYSRLGSSVCNMIVSLIGRMTGVGEYLHVIMCCKTAGIVWTRKLQSDIQNETRLNTVSHFNHTNKPPPPSPLLSPPLISNPLKVP